MVYCKQLATIFSRGENPYSVFANIHSVNKDSSMTSFRLPTWHPPTGTCVSVFQDLDTTVNLIHKHSSCMDASSSLWQPRGVGWEGDGREVQDGGDMCLPVASSCWCVAEANTILKSNCPPIIVFCSLLLNIVRLKSLIKEIKKSSTSLYIADPEAKAYLLLREPGGKGKEEWDSDNIKTPPQAGQHLAIDQPTADLKAPCLATTLSPDGGWGWEPAGEWRKTHAISLEIHHKVLPCTSSALCGLRVGHGASHTAAATENPGAGRTDTLTQPWGKELWVHVSHIGSKLVKSRSERQVSLRRPEMMLKRHLSLVCIRGMNTTGHLLFFCWTLHHLQRWCRHSQVSPDAHTRQESLQSLSLSLSTE